jgi:CBS domain containing-hemolysin-like protein
MTTQLVLVAVLSTVAAFLLSASEAAFQRMSRVRAQELLDEGRAGAASLLAVAAEPAGYLAVLTFLRVIAEAATAVAITVTVVAVVESIGEALLISIAVMALVSFIVVGVSPRTLGRQHYDRVALVAAPITRGLRRILGPLARALVALGNAVTPGEGYREGPFHSEAELRDLLDRASETDVIEDSEREMLDSVFDLGDTVAREVMVPRTDMVTITGDKSLNKAMWLFLQTGFSRIPVIGEDNDDVLGLLYLKDVVQRVTADPPSGSLPVDTLQRPMHFVPESKPIDDLLRDMQREQNHFAIVVDEYGGTAGLITIEDILEEIVGEIADEYDREEPGVEPLGDGSVRVPATMDVEDLSELFGLDFDDEEVDTVGGLLAKAIGRVPIVGSSAQVGRLSLTAERMGGRRHRIATVVVRLLDPHPAPAEAGERDRAHAD